MALTFLCGIKLLYDCPNNEYKLLETQTQRLVPRRKRDRFCDWFLDQNHPDTIRGHQISFNASQIASGYKARVCLGRLRRGLQKIHGARRSSLQKTWRLADTDFLVFVGILYRKSRNVEQSNNVPEGNLAIPLGVSNSSYLPPSCSLIMQSINFRPDHLKSSEWKFEFG